MPSHVLVVGGPKSGKLRISSIFCNLKEADIDPDNFSSSHSGIIIPCELSTKYYKTSLKLLIDEYPESRDKKSHQDSLGDFIQWKTEFLSKDTKELRDILEGFIFTINVDEKLDSDYVEGCLESLQSIRLVLDEELEGTKDSGMWPGFFVVVGTGKIKNFDVEDIVISNGFEYVHLEEDGENEFKDKLGKSRIRELLETHEWTEMEKKEKSSVGYESRKMGNLGGMTKSLLGNEDGGDDDDDDDDEDEEESSLDLGAILLKLNIAKEEIKGMNDDEKENHAKKIIDEVMNYL